MADKKPQAMTPQQAAAVVAELQKRAAIAKEKKFTIESYCFDKQIAFITDPSKFKTAVCSRRAGKSEACAADLIYTALTIPRSNSLYVTLTRTSAERIIWRILLNILTDYKIKHKANNKELTIQLLDNNSYIYVSGAKDKVEIEKFRGMSLHKVYVDEAQSFKAYISELVEDVLSWATKDVAGTICLTGTPGPVPAGYFYEMSTRQNEKVGQHKWTLLDNPWIKIKSKQAPEEILADERARKGITETDPTYMREALGLWVRDQNALVYRFNPNINTYKQLPTDHMTYIFGIDIGWSDADAIAVLGYNHSTNNVYLVQEVVNRKQDITSLANQIKELQSKYQPVKMTIDAGALGKKIAEEIKSRHGLNVEPAAKERKLEFIELLNDDLRTGRFKAFEGSIFEADSALIVWDYEGSTKKVSDRTHTDIGDAILYAWKECKHYFEVEIAKKPNSINTNAYMAELEEKEAEAMEAKNKGIDLDWGVEEDMLESIYDIGGYDDY